MPVVSTQTAVPRPELAMAVMETAQRLDGFIAHLALPIQPVAISAGPVPKILRRQRVERVRKAKGQPYARGTVVVGDGVNFNCEESGFEETLTPKDKEALGGAGNAEDIAAANATETVLIAREVACASLLQSVTTFPAAYQQAASAVWSVPANSKPLDDIDNAADKVAINAGVTQDELTLIVGAGAWKNLRLSASIQAQIRQVIGYTDKTGLNRVITPQLVAQAMGIKQILIGREVKNTADELAPSGTQTNVLTRIWADTSAVLAYIAPLEKRGPNLGCTFMWDQLGADIMALSSVPDALRGLYVESYHDINAGEDVIRAKMWDDQVLLNREAGCLITGL